MATATDTTDLGSIREEQARLRARLARARRALRLEMALETGLDLVATIVAVGALFVALDAWLRLGPTARQVLLGVGASAAVAIPAIRSIPRVRAARLDDLSLAMTLDRYRPGTGQQVADVLQLPGQLDDPLGSASPAFVRLAVRRASEALDAADWGALWNRGRTAARLLGFLAVLAVPPAFAAIAPGAARLSVARWLEGSGERWPQRTYLSVAGLGEADRLIAPRDEPLPIEVRADLSDARAWKGGWLLLGRGERLEIPGATDPSAPPGPSAVPESVRLRERMADGSVRDALMTAVGQGRFRHEVPPSSASSTFEVVGGDDWFGPIAIERHDRPALASLALRVREPGSPGDTSRPVDDVRQHLVFLPDTEVELTLVGTEPLSGARVDVHPGAPPALDRAGVRTYVARWTLREATTLEIVLTSEATGLTSKPAFLSIGLMKDREPRVTLRAQGVGAHVTPVATIPLTVGATDDLGLAALRLQVERTVYGDEKTPPKTTKRAIPLPLATEGGRAMLDTQARHDVDLQPSPPPIGAVLRITAEAEDRCARGIQVGRSGTVHIQVVSPDELFYEILMRQRAERSKFLAAVDAVEKQTPLLAGNPPPEALTTVARGLHTNTRQLDQIASRIGDSLQELKLNQVGSPKSLRLLQEGVVDPIRALNGGPVNELRTLLQSLAAGGTRATVDVDRARRLHGEVVLRMKTILDQMSQWESFVDVVNQVAEVIKVEQDVLHATEKAREARTQEIFDDKP